MKFSIKDFFSKCDQIRSLLRVWSHLLKKSLMENFIFCAVTENSKLRSCSHQRRIRIRIHTCPTSKIERFAIDLFYAKTVRKVLDCSVQCNSLCYSYLRPLRLNITAAWDVQKLVTDPVPCIINNISKRRIGVMKVPHETKIIK